jgi:hypothetical protein
MRDTDPNDFRTPIYTQASWSDVVYLPELTHLQWAMVGVMGIIFCLLPETPWWLVQKNRASDAAKVLRKYNGHVEGYIVQETIVRSTLLMHWARSANMRRTS